MESEEKRIEFQVRGAVPVTWGAGAAEWRWRAALAQVARATADSHRPLGFHPSLGFRVEITFYMSEPAFHRSDVDNLIKPVLDTLFKEQRRQAPVADVTGAMFDAYDNQVTKVCATKTRVPRGEEGIDITICWNYDGEPRIIREVEPGRIVSESGPPPTR